MRSAGDSAGAEETETRPDLSTGCDSTKPIDNALVENDAASIDSSNAKLEPDQKLEAAGNNAAGSYLLDTPVSPEPE